MGGAFAAYFSLAEVKIVESRRIGTLVGMILFTIPFAFSEKAATLSLYIIPPLKLVQMVCKVDNM
jgi:hypothetical protein